MASRKSQPLFFCVNLFAILFAFVQVAFAQDDDPNTGVLEVDLIYPRNETYAPTTRFPVVFATRNGKLAPFLDLYVSYEFQNRNQNASRDDWVVGGPSYSYFGTKWYANYSESDPYFMYEGTDRPFDKEGSWTLVWKVSYANCTQERHGRGYLGNSTTRQVAFTIKNGGQEVDLARPPTDENCDKEQGVTVKVTKKVDISSSVRDWHGGDQCAMLENEAPPPADACGITLNSTAATSIVSKIAYDDCRHTALPAACGKDESAASGVVPRGLSAALALWIVFFISSNI